MVSGITRLNETLVQEPATGTPDSEEGYVLRRIGLLESSAAVETPVRALPYVGKHDLRRFATCDRERRVERCLHAGDLDLLQVVRRHRPDALEHHLVVVVHEQSQRRRRIWADDYVVTVAR